MRRVLWFEPAPAASCLMTPLLSIRNLRTYIHDGQPPVKAVDGVDLDLKEAQLLSLVGESGCGKTMLALSIGRLLPPAARIISGQILFEGTDLTTLNEEGLRLFRGKRIAYIFQDPMGALNPVMSVGEQLLETIHLHQGLAGKAAFNRALELLTQVKIPNPTRWIHQYPHQLSGGMRQRVMIAIALSGKPQLLIADEPTTALDVTTQAEILALLKELRESLKMAILLITHDLMAVAPFSDRITVMYAGRIVEGADTKQLYQAPSHPYTQALLTCLPQVGKGRQSLQAIPGTVPDLRFTPTGCPFHPRCPEVISRCREEEPILKPIADRHTVSCWRCEN